MPRPKLPKKSKDELAAFCDLCDKRIYHRNRIWAHQAATHYNQKLWKCQHCGREFSENSNYYRHLRLLHGVLSEFGIKIGNQIFKCDLCGKQFHERNDMIRHTRAHSGEKKYQCSATGCRKGFTLKGNLRRHTEQVHQTESQACMCDKCGKKFSHLFQLEFHNHKEHSAQTIWPCTECGKTFSNAPYLRMHKRTHGEESIRCDFCDAKFRTPQLKWLHVIMHKLEKCPGCQMKFRTYSAYNQHFRRYHGERNQSKFSCDACDSYWNKQDDLWDHIQECHLPLHCRARIKKFMCDECRSGWHNYASLHMHVRHHHIYPPKIALIPKQSE